MCVRRVCARAREVPAGSCSPLGKGLCFFFRSCRKNSNSGFLVYKSDIVAIYPEPIIYDANPVIGWCVAYRVLSTQISLLEIRARAILFGRWRLRGGERLEPRNTSAQPPYSHAFDIDFLAGGEGGRNHVEPSRLQPYAVRESESGESGEYRDAPDDGKEESLFGASYNSFYFFGS